MTKQKRFYGDPSLKLSMPYGAYGPYEQDFYDGKISFEDFNRLCQNGYGDDKTKDELRKEGYEIED